MTDDHLASAKKAKAAGDYAAALAAYKAAVEQTGNVMLIADVCQMQRLLGLLEESTANAELMLELMPDAAVAHRRLGEAARETGDYTKALSCFEAAFRLQPDVTTQGNLSQLLRLNNRLDEAEDISRRILQQHPASPIGWVRLGQVLRERNDLHAALDHFCRALQLQVTPETLGEIANIQRLQGQYNEADNTVGRLQQDYPRHAITWVRLGELARDYGEYSLALGHFRHAYSLIPERRSLAHISQLQRLLGDLDAAESSAGLLRKRYPHAATGSIRLGEVLLDRGDFAGALGCFREAQSLAADTTNVARIAQCLRELGRQQECDDWLLAQTATALQPGQLWYQLGMNMLYAGDSGSALACFRRGQQAQPDNVLCYRALVMECLRLGLLDTAVDTLYAARNSTLSHAEISLLEIRVLRSAGQLESAQQLAATLWTNHQGGIESGVLLTELLIACARLDEADVVLRQLPDSSSLAALQLANRLARARYDMELSARLLEAAIARYPSDVGAYQQLALTRLLQGQAESARQLLATHRRLGSAHASSRTRARATHNMTLQLLAEFRTNPFACKALADAARLPRHDQPAAIGAVLAEEPGHAGAAVALLVALNSLGVWQHASPRDIATPIPRTIVQFWDSADVPADIRATIQSWMDVCTGFCHRLFNDDTARAFISSHCNKDVQRAFHMANHPAMRSDLFRLAYLYVNGGIYADSDDLCRHSPAPWLEAGYDLLLLQEDIGSIGNNLLAAAPGHPLLGRVLDSVTRNILQRQGDNVWFLSGPGVVSVEFCRFYHQSLAGSTSPPGVRVRDFYQMQQKISMHLPRRYKQDERSWNSTRAAPAPLFRFGGGPSS